MEILFAALRPGARLPSKRPEDAGYDIYPCFDEPLMLIAPHETAIVPSGIICAFPEAYVAILKERGSTGTRGIGQRAGVIDSGYRGEWLISLTNLNDRALVILKQGAALPPELADAVVYPYEKAICQAVFVALAPLAAREATVDEIRAIGSARGDGRLGSTEK